MNTKVLSIGKEINTFRSNSTFSSKKCKGFKLSYLRPLLGLDHEHYAIGNEFIHVFFPVDHKTVVLQPKQLPLSFKVCEIFMCRKSFLGPFDS